MATGHRKGKPRYKSQRSDTPLVVLRATEEVARYMFKITSNEKAFPRAYRNVLCNVIREECIMLMKNVAVATSIPLTQKDHFDKLRSMQDIIRDNIIELCTCIQIAIDITKLSNPQYIVKIISELRFSFDAWVNYTKRKERRFDERAEMTFEEKLADRDNWVNRRLHHMASGMERDDEGFVLLKKHVDKPKEEVVVIQKDPRDGYEKRKRQIKKVKNDKALN